MSTRENPHPILGQIEAKDFRGFVELGQYTASDVADLLLGRAAKFAQVPISGFRVGAFVKGHSGRCYLGANLEFIGVPLNTSLHAEQSAVINAWMHGENGIDSLYVSEKPCGHCLQFLQEVDRRGSLKLYVEGKAQLLKDFLPEPFFIPEAQETGLFDRKPQVLYDLKNDEDAMAQRAINAACASYTPYSESPEGLILETIDGAFCTGRTIESAAFNPSVSPVIAALNQRNLSSQRKAFIHRAIHAKLATALNHSIPLSQAVLKSISNIELEVRLMERSA